MFKIMFEEESECINIEIGPVEKKLWDISFMDSSNTFVSYTSWNNYWYTFTCIWAYSWKECFLQKYLWYMLTLLLLYSIGCTCYQAFSLRLVRCELFFRFNSCWKSSAFSLIFLNSVKWLHNFDTECMLRDKMIPSFTGLCMDGVSQIYAFNLNLYNNMWLCCRTLILASVLRWSCHFDFRNNI